LNTFLKEIDNQKGSDAVAKEVEGAAASDVDAAAVEKKSFEFKIDDDLGEEPEAIVHAEAISDDEEEESD